MKIVFTGASSFSGMWFVEELVKAGHEVIATLQKKEYTDLRGIRVKRVEGIATIVPDCSFGSSSFLKIFENETIDLLCHHAADVTNYKSPDFDPVEALKNNVGELSNILKKIKASGCHKIVLTGSVFEQREGAGSEGLRAVSPYGLSKGLTSDVFKFYSEIYQFSLGKFVIPNPFGPFEEFRFTSFLIDNWFKEKEVTVSHPSYVRDNIPISLLAKAYRKFAEDLPEKPGFIKLNPSGYPESQGAFTERFSKEMRKRLPLSCAYTLLQQKDFSEPKVRLNTDLLDFDKLNWDEKLAWDQLAAYYESKNGITVS